MTSLLAWHRSRKPTSPRPSANRTVSVLINLILLFFMVPVGSCSAICAVSISAKLGCQPNAPCKPHTANIFISKLIRGTVSVSHSVGMKTQIFPLFFTCFSADSEQ